MREPFANQNNRVDPAHKGGLPLHSLKPKANHLPPPQVKDTFFNSDANTSLWRADMLSFTGKEQLGKKELLFKSSSSSQFPEAGLKFMNLKKELKAVPDGSTHSRTPPKLDKEKLKSQQGLLMVKPSLTLANETQLKGKFTIPKLIDYQEDIVKELLRTNSNYRLKKMSPTEQAQTQKALDEMKAVLTTVNVRTETKVFSYWLLQFMAQRNANKDKLLAKLIGCIMVASKVEEYYPPTIKELITTVFKRPAFYSPGVLGSWEKPEHHLESEWTILSQLNFRTIIPHLTSLAELILNESGYQLSHSRKMFLPRRAVHISSLAGVFDNDMNNLAVALLLWCLESGSENTNYFPLGPNLNTEQDSFFQTASVLFRKKYSVEFSWTEIQDIRKHIQSKESGLQSKASFFENRGMKNFID